MKFPDPKKFTPKNRNKYNGDVDNIWYRSKWELKMMKYFDNHPDIIVWSSEEFAIPYFSPVDNKVHKYFPDFIAKIRNKNGKIKTYVFEVKPHKQTIIPKERKRKTKGYLIELSTYATNQAKWRAADIFCQENGMTFKILTEKDISF
ncbi:MAG: TnsA endonuclease N-terminal domain-containing protein [Tissierellia bacterium]|nr:TnsA endonuclease N-terminal domain-containing protein [Tissierellia bacterium]